MRSVIFVEVNVPNISYENQNYLLENFGIQTSANGFIGLPEDLDFFFSHDCDNDCLKQAFNRAREKWNDGDLKYIG